MTDVATKPPTSRQKAKAATRAKVLATARKLFSRSGYEAATVRDIASAAGMSTGAIFANFTDKAALYAEVYGHPPISTQGARFLTDAAKPLVDLIAAYPPSMGEDDDETVEVPLGDLKALKRALAQAVAS